MCTAVQPQSAYFKFTGCPYALCLDIWQIHLGFTLDLSSWAQLYMYTVHTRTVHVRFSLAQNYWAAFQQHSSRYSALYAQCDSAQEMLSENFVTQTERTQIRTLCFPAHLRHTAPLPNTRPCYWLSCMLHSLHNTQVRQLEGRLMFMVLEAQAISPHTTRCVQVLLSTILDKPSMCKARWEGEKVPAM